MMQSKNIKLLLSFVEYFEFTIKLNEDHWKDLRSNEGEVRALKDIANQVVLSCVILFDEEDLSYKLVIPPGSEIVLEMASQRK